MAGRKKLAIILGIRPDVIRASIILNLLRVDRRLDLEFIWSGQHYSENLKDIFFRELEVPSPSIELNARGETDSEIVSATIDQLYPILEKLQPEATVFLGDNNTVMGCIAAAQLNIPIVHIEGCMRSYDWRMPEEKYRIVADHLSDVIYAYLDEYRAQGIAEGLNPNSIVVTGNPIVDVLNKHYFAKIDHYRNKANEEFFADRRITMGNYYVMTSHRRENVHDSASLRNILNLVASTKTPVYFPASYRTQRLLKANSLDLPANVIMVDPVGYDEFLILISNSLGIFTDSGTVVEEACIMHIPCVQMRTSTERPQVYDVGACVKFDPRAPGRYPADGVLAKLAGLRGKRWSNPFGDGGASERIANDLIQRLDKGSFERHRPSDYHLNIRRSYIGDD